MSEFDKEAEREKLREKYGDEPADREATERMSDLLLKGATMTNRHCSECGDPIFRYDGQAFCPTCQEPVGTAEADEPAEGVAADTGPDADGEAAADAAGGENGAGESRQAGGVGGTDRVTDVETPSVTPDADEAGTPSRTPQDHPPAAGASGEAGDLGAAEASLSRQVADLAATAEGTDDLAHKRELLAVAREAAEALAAVRQASGREDLAGGPGA